jgi:hypothetical protein
VLDVAVERFFLETQSFGFVGNHLRREDAHRFTALDCLRDASDRVLREELQDPGESS